MTKKTVVITGKLLVWSYFIIAPGSYYISYRLMRDELNDLRASGLLGRAVGQKFANEGDDGAYASSYCYNMHQHRMTDLYGLPVIPMAFTRAGVDSTYTKLDLIDTKAAEGWFATHAVTKYRRGDNSR